MRCVRLVALVAALAPHAIAAQRPDSAAVPLPVRQLAPNVYAVPGDSGRGSEGRPNAGFVVTRDGVVLVDALGSPEQGERLRLTIRRVTPLPVRWVVLTHHHPDHHFGTIVFTRADARVIAHPDRRTTASENGEGTLLGDWIRAVGLRAMRGFAFADTPDLPITHDTALVLGGRELVLLHPPDAHTAGDLAVWLPDVRVLFAGDVLVEDGVTLIADGSGRGVLRAVERMRALDPRVVVPGHGRIESDPARLLDRTAAYMDSALTATRAAVARGEPMSRLLKRLPPADPERPVSSASREQRNAVRLYLEAERELMRGDTAVAAAAPLPRAASPESAAVLIDRDSATVLDVRGDLALYLAKHLPRAAYLSTETLRSTSGGLPNVLLPAASYATLFTRLGVRRDRPVVVYASGESRGVDATYTAWILAGLGHPRVFVLDGGLTRWELENRPLTRRYPNEEPGAFEPRAYPPERATLDDVRRALGSSGTVLVDARVHEQYVGDAALQVRRGHIPGAISHYWQGDLVTRDLARVWRPAPELRAAYAAQGITPDRAVIVYCNGGLESSHVWFTLRALLGYPRVRIYEGSWTEWVAHDELPIATGPDPGPTRASSPRR